jgi:hypothetical protein
MFSNYTIFRHLLIETIKAPRQRKSTSEKSFLPPNPLALHHVSHFNTFARDADSLYSLLALLMISKNRGKDKRVTPCVFTVSINSINRNVPEAHYQTFEEASN